MNDDISCEGNIDEVGFPHTIFALKTALGHEKTVAENLGIKAKRKRARIFSIISPQKLRGYVLIEGEKNVAVLGQAFARGGVLHLVLLNEFIERFLGIGLRFGLPDLMQIRLGFRLNALGHLVEHVGRLVDPATLFTSFRKDLTKCRPEPQLHIR